MKDNEHNKARYLLSSARGVPIEADSPVYRERLRSIRAFGREKMRPEDLAREIKSAAADARAGTPDLVRTLALSCELSKNLLGLEPFDSQLLAALALADNCLVQMQTGEGKTLAAALALVPAALGGGGIHVFTANDYLARRDAGFLAPFYRAWGLSCAFVTQASSPEERRRAYAADLTYLSVQEAGFDYLKDQLASEPSDYLQRPLAAALVDEADFIMIDEARLPLVLAGTRGKTPPDLDSLTQAAGALEPGRDVLVDLRGRRVSLSLEGEKRLVDHYGLAPRHEADPDQIWARLSAALHARFLLEKGRDYLVREGRIELIDEVSSRVADRRQWPWGIQAALESKEGLAPKPEGRILASISVQHFLELYPRLAGMTATAVDAAPELSAVYKVATYVVEPELPCRRVDEEDRIFYTRAEKIAALIEEICAEHAKGRPVLVGTSDIAESEEIASSLRRIGLDCHVLNAAQDAREAELIARAGQPGAVTVATDMAGRGTDIRLGGGRDFIERSGGLCVLGTLRHESPRLDKQLRGRAGRQGDPGRSCFFLSLEDRLFVKYGVREFLPRPYRKSENRPADLAWGRRIDDPVVKREVDRAQRLIESEFAQIRRTLRKYSLLPEFERRFVRQLREEAISRASYPEELSDSAGTWPTPAPDAEGFPASDADGGLPQSPENRLAPDVSSERLAALKKRVFLARLDRFWAEHLALAEDIREGIPFVVYGGRDPYLEYTRELAQAFEANLGSVLAQVRADWEALEADPASVDLEGPELGAPGSTWTYQASDQVSPSFTLSMIASSNLGAAALAAFPVFVLEGLVSVLKSLGRKLKRLLGRR